MAITKPDEILQLEKFASYKCDGGCIFNHPAGTFIIKYLKVNGTISRTIQYRMDTDVLWHLGQPEDLLSVYHPAMRLELVSQRRYGMPKLSKPPEIKGIPESFGLPYIWGGQNNVKVTNQVFIKGNDVFVKVRDYMSDTFRPPLGFTGAPLSVILKNFFPEKTIKSKFIYDDCWGNVVLRSEAWVCFRNVLPLIKEESLIISLPALVKLSQKLPGFGRDWEFFCEGLINQVKNDSNKE